MLTQLISLLSLLQEQHRLFHHEGIKLALSISGTRILSGKERALPAKTEFNACLQIPELQVLRRRWLFLALRVLGAAADGISGGIAM